MHVIAATSLPVRNMSESLTGCCPPFDPVEWDGQLFEFSHKPFVKFRSRSFFHIPLNVSRMMKKTMQKVEAANAMDDAYLMLSDESSPWHADHYLAVKKDVPRAEMTDISGTFMTKVFEGPYENMPVWYDQLVHYVAARGRKPIKTYFSYTMCPNCAKAYGKNYVVGFEQIK